MGLVKRCEEAEESSPTFFFFSTFHSKKIFAIEGEFSLL